MLVEGRRRVAEAVRKNRGGGGRWLVLEEHGVDGVAMLETAGFERRVERGNRGGWVCGVVKR